MCVLVTTAPNNLLHTTAEALEAEREIVFLIRYSGAVVLIVASQSLESSVRQFLISLYCFFFNALLDVIFTIDYYSCFDSFPCLL